MNSVTPPLHYDSDAWHGIHPWRRLLRMMAPEKGDFWVAIIYSLVIGLISLVVPVAVQAVVNTIAFGTLVQPLVALTILVFFALCFAAALQGLRMWVVELIQRRIFVRLAGDTTFRLVHVLPSAFDKYHGPELVNRFLEVVTVQKSAASLMVDGLSVLMQTIVGMILLGIYHPYLLAFVVLMLVFIVLVLFPLGHNAISTSVRESKAKYDLVAWLQEIARHQVAFKTRSGSTLALNQTNQLTTKYLQYRSAHFCILLRQVLGSFGLQAIASALLLGVGGWLVIERELTLGQLVAAELVVALVVSGFTKFGKHLETFYDLMAATDKLGYLEDLPLERTSGEEVWPSSRGAQVRLNNVSVGYAGRAPLIEGADLELHPGARIGILGCAGSGKSSLLDAIYGLRTPVAGVIEFDGHDYRDIQLGCLRAQVALVRTPEIFEGTVLENLRLGNSNIDSAEARAGLQRVGLLDTIQEFPDGLNTVLATGGQPLSPGQAMQFELARAILSEPRLLILDECLDHLDDLPQRERLLNVLFAPSAPWTLLVVSEKPDILARCERVYRLGGRKLVPEAELEQIA